MEEELVPLKNIVAHIEITGLVAKINIEHRYKNNANRALKTKLVFPVDYGVAIGALKITTNNCIRKA